MLNGQGIKKGEKVVVWYASSSRDETRYEDPDRFDILRNPTTRHSAPAATTSASAPPVRLAG